MNSRINMEFQNKYWIERIEAELAFAIKFVELYPSRKREWTALIEKAKEKIENTIKINRCDLLPEAVKDAEKIMAPIGVYARKHVIHCVGHAHIDMNWMWSWPETVSVTIDTFTTVLKLMEKYKEFSFSQSQASTYRIIEKYRPDLLEMIRKKIAEKRWEVTATHWVECDRNMISGESLYRHVLYTREYMQKLFGLPPESVQIDWAPDTFGHPATVPDYLVKSGIKYVYLHRPGVYTRDKHPVFWWKGCNGNKVLVRNDMKLAYNGVIAPEIALHMVDFNKFTGGRNYMFVYGVGDHGGGPTVRDIERIIDMNKWPVFPAIKFSFAQDFYENLEKESGGNIPVVCGELNTEFTGCYTTQSLIKKSVRTAEARLLDCEFALVAAEMLGNFKAIDLEKITQTWHDLLLLHFHDILPGSGVHDTRTYAHGLYQEIIAFVSSKETMALRLAAEKIKTNFVKEDEKENKHFPDLQSIVGAGVGFDSCEGFTFSDQSGSNVLRPFVIFNPVAIERNEIVELTIWGNARDGKSIREKLFQAVDSKGGIVDTQIVKSGTYWGHDFVTLAFPVRVPSSGYATYVIKESFPSGRIIKPESVAKTTTLKHHCSYAFVERSKEGLENDYISLEIDPATGGIRQLYDKASGRNMIIQNGYAQTIEYAVEKPHPMSSWLIDHTGKIEFPVVRNVKRILDGPYKASIQVETFVHNSEITLTYELRANDPKLYLTIEGFWFERGTPHSGVPVLSLALPLELKNITTISEIPFGAIERNFCNKEEFPSLNWTAACGWFGQIKGGCVLFNDSKHGYSLERNVLRLTLIRSAYEPDTLPEAGNFKIRLALMMFKGKPDIHKFIRMGQIFNRHLKTVSTTVHEGKHSPVGKVLGINAGNTIISSMRKGSNGSITICIYNPGKRRESIVLEDVVRYGFKTLYETDLVNRYIAHHEKAFYKHKVIEKINPFDIKCLVLKKERGYEKGKNKAGF